MAVIALINFSHGGFLAQICTTCVTQRCVMKRYLLKLRLIRIMRLVKAVISHRTVGESQ